MSVIASPIVLLALGSCVFFAGVVRADDDTPSYTIEDVTACSADAMRLCRDKMPNVEAIEQCMKSNYDSLRPKCKARMDRER